MSKIVVITGSTRGIGRGLAEAFAERGHAVVLSGRKKSEVALAAMQIQGAAGTVCDVADREQVQALWDFAIAQHGRVDIWINNAGYAVTHKWTRDLLDEDIHAMVEANLIGSINGTRVALGGMEDQGFGWIWTMLGGGSDGRYRDRMGGYGMTKLGLKYFTDSLIKELDDGPVKIGTIKPGILISDGFKREARHLDPAVWPKLRDQLNMLADRVEDVAPWIVEQVLDEGDHGREVTWLTGGKITKRIMAAKLLGKTRDVVPVGLD